MSKPHSEIALESYHRKQKGASYVCTNCNVKIQGKTPYQLGRNSVRHEQMTGHSTVKILSNTLSTSERMNA